MTNIRIVFYSIIAIAFVLALAARIYLKQTSPSDKELCESKGGKVMALYRSSICISEDGRVLQ